MTTRSRAILLGTALLLACVASLRGQVNYEIQVYPSETVAPGTLMIELHSNLTFQGESRPSVALPRASMPSTRPSS